MDGKPVPDATLKNDDGFEDFVRRVHEFTGGELGNPRRLPASHGRAAGKATLCTTFSEFTNFFGEFGSDAGQNMLAHAVYGFFNNGGSRCYVARESKAEDIKTKV